MHSYEFLPGFLRIVPEIAIPVSPRISVGVFDGVSARLPPGVSSMGYPYMILAFLAGFLSENFRHVSKVASGISLTDFPKWFSNYFFPEIFAKKFPESLPGFLFDFLGRFHP